MITVFRELLIAAVYGAKVEEDLQRKHGTISGNLVFSTANLPT